MDDRMLTSKAAAAMLDVETPRDAHMRLRRAGVEPYYLSERRVRWWESDVQRVLDDRADAERRIRIREEHGERGFIYAIRCSATGCVKIGWAMRPERRYIELQVGSPAEHVRLGDAPGTRGDEVSLHSQFAALRVRGEWFSPEAEAEITGWMDDRWAATLAPESMSA
ncbi:MAG: hypothetical protein JWL76_2113 [Thermoleophilia bacterium]|nr:hypothetical protein [Thermoleophilia bacterium]